MPWCASDTSPGLGRCPPPISPTAEIVWGGSRHGRAVTTAVRARQAGDAVEARGLEGFGEDHHRQEGGQPRASLR
jgi:hypothetical protein